MVPRTELPRAGWYNDPGNPSTLRWWNGTSWTADVRGYARPTSARWRWIGASVMAFLATVVVALVVAMLVAIAYVDLFDDPRQPGWAVFYGGLTVVPVIALLRSVRGARQRHLSGSALLIRVSQQLLLVGVVMIFAGVTWAALASPL